MGAETTDAAWGEALRQAEAACAAAASEDEWRAVAVRACDLACGQVLDSARRCGYHGSGEAGERRRLIDFLKVQQDATLRLVGRRHLPRLRALANHARHEPDIEFTPGFAREALDLAGEIVFELLAPAQP